MQPHVLHESPDASLFAGGGHPSARITGLAVRFHLEPVRDEAKSAEAGRPVYVEREYIEIITPGDKTTVIDRPVRDTDKRAYAQQYAAFKAGDEMQLVGTPLVQWPGCSRAQVMELAHFGCRTVEQLAEMSDGNLGNVGPLRALRDAARAYLETARGQAPITKMQAELEAARLEMAAMRQKLDEATAALARKAKG